MGHVLVLFYSKDENTQKVVNDVAEGASGIPGIEVVIKAVKTVQ